MVGSGACAIHVKVGPRLPAEMRISLPGLGNLVYYSTTQNFVAECKQEGHDRCFKTRTGLEGRRRPQGRPLGHLFAWLRDTSFTGKLEHQAYQPGAVVRNLARQHLREIAGADSLFASERPPREGEGSEPEMLP